jgi:ribosome biogenesis GTPase
MQAKLTGKVTKSTRSQYQVYDGNRILSCVVRGKLVGLKENDISSIKVGDDVIVERTGRSEGVILDILPRKSKLSRAVEGKAYKEHIIATNIDQMVIISSTKNPVFKAGLIDRYLVIAEKNNLTAVICLNKIDLAETEHFEEYTAAYRSLNYELFCTSALTGQGVGHLHDILKNKLSVMVGQSGVGKSSLIQKIEPGLELAVSETSEKTSKGRHTTSYVELFPLSFGGYIIDTPGIRELGLWDIYRNDLRKYFVEMVAVQNNCQFADCQHLSEPGCAVKTAVEEGRIFPERYKNYTNIYQDLRAASYELIKRR